MKSWAAAIGLILLSLMGRGTEAQTCKYNFKLESVVTKQDLQPREKLKVAVSLPSNKAHAFSAIQGATLAQESKVQAGQAVVLGKGTWEIELNMKQVEILQAPQWAQAYKGLQINVWRSVTGFEFFRREAGNFFTQPVGSMLLQEINYLPAGLNAQLGFDPRALIYQNKTSKFQVESNALVLNFAVIKSGSCPSDQ